MNEEAEEAEAGAHISPSIGIVKEEAGESPETFKHSGTTKATKLNIEESKERPSEQTFNLDLVDTSIAPDGSRYEGDLRGTLKFDYFSTIKGEMSGMSDASHFLANHMQNEEGSSEEEETVDINTIAPEDLKFFIIDRDRGKAYDLRKNRDSTRL